MRALLIVGLVGVASSTLTNTTRQTLLSDRLTNQSLLGSGETCSALGRHCNQRQNNCTNRETGSYSCSLLVSRVVIDWVCGSEATCCVENSCFLYPAFNGGDAHFCDGASAAGDFGTNDFCCSGQCCISDEKYEKFKYKCGHDCHKPGK